LNYARTLSSKRGDSIILGGHVEAPGLAAGALMGKVEQEQVSISGTYGGSFAKRRTATGELLLLRSFAN